MKTISVSRFSEQYISFVESIIYGFRIALVRHGLYATVLLLAGNLVYTFYLKDNTTAPLISQVGVLGIISATLMATGLVWLFTVWMRLKPLANIGKIPKGVFLIWCLPLLFSPPLLSNDAYSYAAQGLILNRGMDPYLSGPIIVPGPYADQVDPIWLYAPAPYGPLALRIQQMVTVLFPNDAYLSAVMMRIPAFLAVCVSIYLIYRISDMLGANNHYAFWAFALNPLVLIHFVGGAHNDSIMLAFALLGVLFALRNQSILAYISIACAAGIKQTGVLALLATAGIIVFNYRIIVKENETIKEEIANWKGYSSLWIQSMGMRWKRLTTIIKHPKMGLYEMHKGNVKENIKYDGKISIIALVYEGLYQMMIVSIIFSLFTLICGLSFGWMKNFSATLSINSLLSPPTLFGNAINIIIQPFASSVAPETVIGLCQKVGIIAGAMLMVMVAAKIATRKPVYGLAVVWLAFVLASPVVHAWYLIPSIALASFTSDRITQAVLVWGTFILVSYAIMDISFTTGAWLLSIIALVRFLWIVIQNDYLFSKHDGWELIKKRVPTHHKIG